MPLMTKTSKIQYKEIEQQQALRHTRKPLILAQKQSPNNNTDFSNRKVICKKKKNNNKNIGLYVVWIMVILSSRSSHGQKEGFFRIAGSEIKVIREQQIRQNKDWNAHFQGEICIGICPFFNFSLGFFVNRFHM